MNDETKTALEDLSFLRGLVEKGDGGSGMGFAVGEAYLAAGLLYGLQVVGHLANAHGLLPLNGLGQLALGIGPTVIFLGVMVWIWRRHPAQPGGLIGKAVGAGFAAAGLANLALIAMFAYLAFHQQSLLTWLIYPAVVFVLQGAAWVVAFMLRRRAWLLAVGLGWFAEGIAMAMTLGSEAYLWILGLGLLGLMAIPGWVLMRLARREA
jgi:hypothetical protein